INYPSDNPRIIIKKPVIIDPLEKQTTTNSDYASALIVRRNLDDLGGATGEYIGNIEIIQPVIYETRPTKKIQSAIHIKNLNEGKVDKVSIIDPIKVEGLQRKLLQYAENIVISDKNNVLVKYMNDSNVSVSA